MRIGVVGNRQGWTYQKVMMMLFNENLTEEDIIVTGGAIGVDQYAVRYGFHNGIDVVIKHPRISIGVPERYFERNQRIVDDVDRLIAFDSKYLDHSGTRHTINRAKERGIPIKIIQ